jgi:2-polyprenyl-3-methyl-5-hydroxy-6-metoxy-1,4-benzoquinol methylase
MARYKFAAKMFASRESVLEIGCGGAFCAPIILQTVRRLTVTDFDAIYIEDAKARMREPWTFDAVVCDIGKEPLSGRHDAIFALDVIEHVPQSEEDRVMHRIVDALEPNGRLSSACPRWSRRALPRRRARRATSTA